MIVRCFLSTMTTTFGVPAAERYRATSSASIKPPAWRGKTLARPLGPVLSGARPGINCATCPVGAASASDRQSGPSGPCLRDFESRPSACHARQIRLA
jgi:hypothetical protein